MNKGHAIEGAELVQRVQQWGQALGFSHVGVAGISLEAAEPGLLAWLQAGFHGGMGYMQRHGLTRARPAELVPGTVSVITARMNYLPIQTGNDWAQAERERLLQPGEAVVSLYARGRDYHKVLRQRLQQLAEQLAAVVGPLQHRVFTDSAPVLEVELATRSGLAWRGKHTLALHREAGSMFFLGEVFVDMALPPTEAVPSHCGQCEACLQACPTGAIVAPYKLDARRCISYLTIEHEGAIPLELRRAVGNRIYGCDDCQLVCPWNKYAQRSLLADFNPRHGLDAASLSELWQWSEPQFMQRMQGSAIRRIGWLRWRRNLAVSMGNALAAGADDGLRHALRVAPDADENVREHIAWALAQGGA